MNSKIKFYVRRLLWLSLTITVFFGLGRLYYFVTDGFTIGNITSDLAYDSRWETRPLTDEENTIVNNLLTQKFHYLGKGCQSYVFESEDGQYVLKFFKYQRMKPRTWLAPMTFIPVVDDYLKKKNAKKRRKLEGVFNSWKIAFDHLPKETAVAYVHLNKTAHLDKTLTINDKLGLSSVLNIDDYEFMIQKKAVMVCDHINSLMSSNRFDESILFLHSLVDMILGEYQRGIADNDHALIQNTGVFNGEPIHVDIGQFVIDESVKEPQFHMQELFTKTYKFRLWLKESHPDLYKEFDRYLHKVIGDDFVTMQPLWRNRIEIFQ